MVMAWVSVSLSVSVLCCALKKDQFVSFCQRDMRFSRELSSTISGDRIWSAVLALHHRVDACVLEDLIPDLTCNM